MNTDIDFLKDLETDLEDMASRERIRLQRVTLQGSIRRNTGRTWMKVSVAAAAFLVVAGSIGFLAGGSASDKFQEVGDAVASDGGARGRCATCGWNRRAQRRRPRVPTGGLPPQPSPAPNEGSDGQQQDLSKIVRDGRIGIVVRGRRVRWRGRSADADRRAIRGLRPLLDHEQRPLGNVRPPHPGANGSTKRERRSATSARASGSRRCAATT